MADKRITPARPDLAAAHLKGQVEAARFVEGKDYSCGVGHVGLRRSPDPLAEQDTELLRGDRFTVYEEKNGWAWGQIAADGYVGYAPAEALAKTTVPTHRVIARSTPLLSGPGVKTAARDFLPLGSLVAGQGLEGDFFKTDGGYVYYRHLAAADHRETDFVAVAERFVGVPYVWGGKTSAGMDCSGLIQTALTASGVHAPRDTDMQEKALGAPADIADVTRGDLIFWKGHVGVMTDATHLLHANAFHMQVAREPLAEAVARIGKACGAVTSVRRL